MTQWLSLEDARQRLGVRAQTLYAYASRGRVAVCHDPQDPRRSLYRAEDIDGLAARKLRRRKPAAIAASALSWGEPSIPTRISTIAGGRLFYRGQDAVGLAGHATLEEAAALLWERTPAPVFAPALPPGDAGHSPRERAFLALSRAAAASLPCLGRTRPVLQLEAAGLVGILAASFGAAEGARPLHELLAQGWGCAPATAELLRQALVLLADQELTTSAFAARVTASTGASLAAAALSGLAALTGPLHGDATTQVRLLFEDVSACGVERAVGRHLASGLPVPGFGHRLYPDGDPRAAALLAAFDPPEEVLATIATVATMTGQRPTIDVALAALARRFALPPDAPFSLFALGRSVGWLAHAMEQSLGGELIRPRARYSGPPVEWPLPDDDKRKSASTSFS